MTALYLTFLLSVVSSTEYYISSSHGSDSNSGTSTQSAWKTFKNVETLTLSGGDKLLLCGGDKWNEQLLINNASGTSQQSILISMYNPTNNTLNRPHIDVSNTKFAYDAAVICTNCQMITFNSLEISHATYGIKYTFVNIKGIFHNYNTSNCFFHEINGLNYSAKSGNWWGAAILTGSDGPSVRLENFIMENNMLNASDTFFNIYKGGTQPAVIGSGYMKSTLLTHNYYNVMFLGDAMYNFTIEDNVFLHDTPNQEFLYGTTDIIVGTCDYTCSIINNEFGYRGEYPGGPDGCSIDFETHAVGSKVIGNYIHDSYGAAIMVFGHPDTNQLNANLTINNNIFIRDGCIQTRDDHGTIAFMWPASGFIENNFFVKCINQSVPIYWDRNNDTFLDNWIFMNNTIQNYTDGYVVDDPIVNVDNNNQLVQVSAKCGSKSPQCVLRYTIDGSKPNLNSIKYEQNQILKFYITTPVLFKAFQNGLIESATVGQIVNPL
eukprot:365346_1